MATIYSFKIDMNKIKVRKKFAPTTKKVKDKTKYDRKRKIHIDY